MSCRLILVLCCLALAGCGSTGTKSDMSADLEADHSGPELSPEADSRGDTAADLRDAAVEFESHELLVDAVDDARWDADPADEIVEETDAGPPPDTDGDGLDDPTEAGLGTDPLVWDTDTDGMSDGQEVQDGTDPLDPSSAVMWHPEWSAWPRLVFGPEQVETLRAGLESPQYPVSIAVERILSEAGATALPPQLDKYDPGYEYQRARTAKSAAFVALMLEDQAQALKVLEIAAGINSNLQEVDFQSPFYSKTDIHAAEAITYYCQAYDFLAGSGLVSQPQLDAMEESISQLVLALEDTCTNGPLQFLLSIAQNNHNIKTYTAIGLAGLTFNRSPHAARWVNRGVTEATWYLLNFQVTEDGGYAEGPGYLIYGAGNALVFLHAWRGFAGGKSYYFRNFFDTRDVTGPEFEWLPDPAASSLLESLFLWPLRIMTPDGRAPNFDDSALATMPSGYLAAFFGQPLFLWHWEFASQNHSTSAGLSMAVDTYALWDANATGVPPDWAHDQFLPAAGNCALRDGWTSDASWALLMGENGKMRLNGGGHEHGEAFHLSYWARGEYWLLDAGYINWEEKAKVSEPENHNLILVDGVGPPSNQLTGYGTDTFLTGFTGSDSASACTSSTQYEDVQFSRTAVHLPQYGLLLAADRLIGSAAHNYSVLWHGNGGGSSGGELLLVPGGAEYTRGDQGLVIACASTWGSAELSSSESAHSFNHSQELSHEALICDFDGDSGLVLSLFAAGAAGQPAWVPEVLQAGDGVVRIQAAGAFGESVQAVAVAGFSAPLVVDLPCGEYELSEPFAVVLCPIAGEPETFYAGSVSP